MRFSFETPKSRQDLSDLSKRSYLQQWRSHPNDRRVLDVGKLLDDVSASGDLVKPVVPRQASPVRGVLLWGDWERCHLMATSV